jgi:hypothetical protein
MRACGAPGGRGLRALVGAGVIAVLLLLDSVGCTPASEAAVSRVSAPLVSGWSTPEGSWVTLPMGQLSDESNTFWQLLHASAGAARWSVVTPPGVADNAGIVSTSSGSSVLVGVLPNGLLRFSPVSQSSDGGRQWNSVSLTGAIAAIPDALAYDTASPSTTTPTALAATSRGWVLSSGGGLSSWHSLVSVRRLRSGAPHCGVTAVDAVALQPSGAPIVATGCARGGVGLFSEHAGTWTAAGVTLARPLREASTSVWRLESDGSTTTALVSATLAGHTSLVALRSVDGAAWKQSSPLPLGAGAHAALATAVGPNGTLAVLYRKKSGVAAAVFGTGGSWSGLPQPPRSTTALAPSPMTSGGSTFEALAVDGSELGVFGLSPSGSSWVRLQSIKVELAYGSSS